jgi:hypothetical protein
MTEGDTFEEIGEWFTQRGFILHFAHEKDDVIWATLCRLPSGKEIAPMYGRGQSELEAARRAKQRYEQEE